MSVSSLSLTFTSITKWFLIYSCETPNKGHTLEITQNGKDSLVRTKVINTLLTQYKGLNENTFLSQVHLFKCLVPSWRTLLDELVGGHCWRRCITRSWVLRIQNAMPLAVSFLSYTSVTVSATATATCVLLWSCSLHSTGYSL